jgi:hypothetical protein
VGKDNGGIDESQGEYSNIAFAALNQQYLENPKH